MPKCWIYHESETPKIVDAAQAEAFYAGGWADSPARFIKLESVGVDKDKVDAGDDEETAKAQSVLDSVEGVKDSLNGALNLGDMDKNELEDYARDHHGVELDKRKSKKNLIKQIKQIIES